MTDKRQQIELAATETVQKKGFNALSFRTLGNEVGVKSSSVHYYFPEKSDLANAIITRYSEHFATLLEKIDADNLTLKNKLDAFVSIFEEVVKNNKFCLCGMMAAEIDSLNDSCRAAITLNFRNIENWILKNLETYSDEVDCVLPKKTLSKIIIAGLEGAILIDRIGRSCENLFAQKKLIHSFLK